MITLAADIGGTRIKLALVANQTLLARDCIEARSHEGLAPQLPRITQAFAALCARVGVRYEDCCAGAPRPKPPLRCCRIKLENIRISLRAGADQTSMLCVRKATAQASCCCASRNTQS